MKINEIPEKIYLDYELDEDKIHIFINYMWHRHPFEDKNLKNVEYIRTDVVIKKVLEFIKERFYFEDSWHVEGETSIMDKVIEDFKKYVEEQQ